jgi:glucose uptake protein GlcU
MGMIFKCWQERQNESNKRKELNLLKYEAVWFLSSVLFFIFYALLKRVITWSSTNTLVFLATQGWIAALDRRNWSSM